MAETQQGSLKQTFMLVQQPDRGYLQWIRIKGQTLIENLFFSDSQSHPALSKNSTVVLEQTSYQ